MTGSLHLHLGPMFSGKTSRLIQISKTRNYICKKVVVVNYAEDKRYHQTMLSTHDKVMIPCIMTCTLGEIWGLPEHTHHADLRSADTVLINEGQFFDDLYSVVLDMVENYGKEVHVCGLDGDFKRNEFGEILKLIPYADSVEKMSALCGFCKDGTPAIFSHRVSTETVQVIIGSDNYVPLCRKCYKNSAY